MGCCWSCEDQELEHIRTQNATRVVRAAPAPGFRGSYESHRPWVSEPKPGPLYGEFKCRCGYHWRSLQSWRDKYQICKHCKTEVLPKNQREVLKSDYSRDKDDVGEHPQDLCEQCIQSGRRCGSVIT